MGCFHTKVERVSGNEGRSSRPSQPRSSSKPRRRSSSAVSGGEKNPLRGQDDRPHNNSRDKRGSSGAQAANAPALLTGIGMPIGQDQQQAASPQADETPSSHPAVPDGGGGLFEKGLTLSLGVGLYEPTPDQGGLLEQSFRPDMFRVRERPKNSTQGPTLENSLDMSSISPVAKITAAKIAADVFTKFSRKDLFVLATTHLWLAYVEARPGAQQHPRAPAVVRRRAVQLARSLTESEEDSYTLESLCAAVSQRLGDVLDDLEQLDALPTDRGLGLAQVYQHLEKGDRRTMEDMGVFFRHLSLLFANPPGEEDPLGELPVEEASEPDFYCCVFDGHAGEEAALYARQRLHAAIVAAAGLPTSSPTADLTAGLVQAFRTVDASFAQLANAAHCDAGTCIVTVVLHGQKLFCASLGDCRAVLCRGSPSDPAAFEAVCLSKPHTVMDDGEAAAVEDRGGLVTWNAGCLRVNGTLQITRSMGDRPERKVLSQTPDVQSVDLVAETDEFIVLSSDGLFELLPCESVCDFVRTYKAVLDELWEWQRDMLRLRKGEPPTQQRRRSTVSPHQETPEPKNGGVEPETCSDSRKPSCGPVSGATGAMLSATEEEEGSQNGSEWSLLSVCAEPEDDAGLMKAQRSLRKLRRVAIEQQERMGSDPMDGDDPDAKPHGPKEESWQDLLKMSDEVAECVDYQLICEGIIGEAYARKSSGRDNVCAQIVMLAPRLLTAEEIKEIREIRAAAQTNTSSRSRPQD